jgi:hypothetical protein
MSNSRRTPTGLLTYVRAEHFLDPDDHSAHYVVGGEYHDTCVKTDDGWRIAEMTLTVRWGQGDKDIMLTAEERGRRLMRLPR